MALSKEGLIQELKHEIHSPLAAIRNALYLAAIRTDDPETQRYLVLADAEIVPHRRSPEKCRSNRRKQTGSSADSVPGSGFRCIRFTNREQKLTISSVFMHSLCCIYSRLSLGYIYALENPLAHIRSSSL